MILIDSSHMSLAVLYSRALNGMDAPLVTVEVHLWAAFIHFGWSARSRGQGGA